MAGLELDPFCAYLYKIRDSIKGADVDNQGIIRIPHINIAIQIVKTEYRDWYNLYLFHYNRSNLDFDYDIFFKMPVPSRWKNNAVDYVVYICLPELIEKWYGEHLDKLYIGDSPYPEYINEYWDKLMADSTAYLAFEKKDLNRK